MRRRLIEIDGKSALVLLPEELAALGITEKVPRAILVKVEANHHSPRLVIQRSPTFDEAMEATLSEHAEAFRRLAAFPTNVELS